MNWSSQVNFVYCLLQLSSLYTVSWVGWVGYIFLRHSELLLKWSTVKQIWQFVEIISLLREITCPMGCQAGWWLYPKMVYLQNTVTYLRNNRAVSWPGIEPMTESGKSNVSTTTPPSHHMWFNVDDLTPMKINYLINLTLTFAEFNSLPVCKYVSK